MNIRWIFSIAIYYYTKEFSEGIFLRNIFLFSKFLLLLCPRKIRNHGSYCSIQKSQVNVTYSCIVGEVMVKTFMHYNKNIKHYLFKRNRQP